MSKLYIIGNGFDIAHNLKTSYWHFRNYLSKYAEDFLIELEKMYGLSTHYSNNNYLDTLWKNFEFQLSQANDEEVFDFSSSVVEQLDLETGLVGIEDTMNSYWEDQYKFILKLNEYLKRWVKQIRLTKAVPKKSDLINNHSDYFLSFNYTNLLELKYNVPSERVLHIHGGLSPYCQGDPVIGHGNADKIERFRGVAKKAEEEFDEATTSINNALADYYQRVFKDTSRYIFVNSHFFKQLSHVDNVIIIGHSLGDVDLPYLREVKSKIQPTTNWTVYYYAEAEKDSLVNAVISIGVNVNNIIALKTDLFWDL